MITENSFQGLHLLHSKRKYQGFGSVKFYPADPDQTETEPLKKYLKL